MPAKRPLRVDARQNRERLLAVAKAVFAAEGLDVPIDEIARRAGLGVGTLYRHFPTKSALFEAIVVSHVERLAEEARALTTVADPGAAFFGFLATLAEGAVAKRDFVDALNGGADDLDRATSAVKRDFRRAFGKLLARAQKVNAVRADLDIADLFALVAGVNAAFLRARDPAARRRILAVVSDGLRPPARLPRSRARSPK